MKDIKFQLVGRNVKFDEIVKQEVTLQQLIDGNFNRSELLTFFDTNNSNCDFIAARRWTGLTDKNGKEIWEEDIVIIDDDGEYFPETYNEDTDEFEPSGKYIVYWSEDSACFWIKDLDGKTPDIEYNPFGYANFEVIGNTYENRELLK